jgi:hypothetical protein
MCTITYNSNKLIDKYELNGDMCHKEENLSKEDDTCKIQIYCFNLNQ